FIGFDGSSQGAALAAGALQAHSSWLMFLPAGAVLETGWIEETTQFIQSVSASGRDRAAVFRYARSPFANTGWRHVLRAVVRKLIGPLGDQGLLIARDHYDRIGGYPPQARHSEARLLRRLGRSSRIMLRSRIVMVG